jgi:Ca-activated chloride channel family protein
MTFAHPLVLLLLVFPLLLALWEWQRYGHPLVLPFDYGQQSRGRVLRRLVNVANLLPVAALTIAIVILAGPQRLAAPEKERMVTNIQFVMDVSGSMTAPFGNGRRSDKAIEAINEFTTSRKGDAFGLTIFGTDVLHWVPLTKDLSAIRLAAPFLRPEKLPPYLGGTRIGKALRAVQKVLVTRPEGERMIILISDGQSSDLFGGAAEEIGTELARDRITVYYIHVAEGPPQNETFTLCSLTGGQAFAAGDPAALREVFQHIDRMQPAQLKPSTPEYSDFFQPFALAGLVVLGLHALAAFGLRYTPW